MQKIISIIAGVALLLSLGAIWFSTHVKSTTNTTISYGATGDTYAQMPIAAIGVNVATITPATLYNNSGRDRIISRVFDTLQTANTYGTSTQFCYYIATSSNPYNLNGNTNYVYSSPGCSSGSGVAGEALSTANGYVMASSTLSSGTGSVGNSLFRWSTGTYLNAVIASTTNTTSGKNTVYTYATGGSTNTRSDSHIGSTTTGFIGVEYYPQ